MDDIFFIWPCNKTNLEIFLNELNTKHSPPILKKGYDQKLVDEQLEKVDKPITDDLLQEKVLLIQNPFH